MLQVSLLLRPKGALRQLAAALTASLHTKLLILRIAASLRRKQACALQDALRAQPPSVSLLLLLRIRYYCLSIWQHFARRPRRGAGVVEQGCLLSSYTGKTGIGGSNPPLSATPFIFKYLTSYDTIGDTEIRRYNHQ